MNKCLKSNLSVSYAYKKGCRCEGCVTSYRTSKRKYYHRNKEKVAKKQAQFKRLNPELVSKWNHSSSIKRKYGVSRSQYKTMVQETRGTCQICGIQPDYRLCVDHCHSTGKIRGLLCRNCNHILGHARDSIKVLKKAIDYLEN